MGCNKRGLEGSKTLVKSFNSSAVTLVVFSPMQDPDKTDPLTGNARYIQPQLIWTNIWMRSHCLGCSLGSGSGCHACRHGPEREEILNTGWGRIMEQFHGHNNGEKQKQRPVLACRQMRNEVWRPKQRHTCSMKLIPQINASITGVLIISINVDHYWQSYTL